MAHRNGSGRWRSVVGATVVLAVLGTACSGDDDADSDGVDVVTDQNADEDAGQGSDQGAGEQTGGDGTADDDGASDAAAGSDRVDFVIPAPDGLVLDALVDAGLDMVDDGTGQRQLYYDGADFDRVVAFYDDWTAANGDWQKSEVEGDVVFVGLDVDVIRTIAITPDYDPGAQADGPVTYVLLVANG